MNPIEEFDATILSAYLDKEASPEEIEIVEARLGSEPELRFELQRLRALREMVGALGPYAPQSDLIASIRKQLSVTKCIESKQAIRESSVMQGNLVNTPDSQKKAPFHRPIFRHRIVWLSLAASLLVAFVGGLVALNRTFPARLTALRDSSDQIEAPKRVAPEDLAGPTEISNLETSNNFEYSNSESVQPENSSLESMRGNLQRDIEYENDFLMPDAVAETERAAISSSQVLTPPSSHDNPLTPMPQADPSMLEMRLTEPSPQSVALMGLDSSPSNSTAFSQSLESMADASLLRSRPLSEQMRGRENLTIDTLDFGSHDLGVRNFSDLQSTVWGERLLRMLDADITSLNDEEVTSLVLGSLRNQILRATEHASLNQTVRMSDSLALDRANYIFVQLLKLIRDRTELATDDLPGTDASR